MPQAEYEKAEGEGDGGGETHLVWETFSAVDKNVFFFSFSKLFFVFVVNLSSLIGALFLLIQAINKRSLWHATYITDILAFDLLFIIRTRKRKVERIRENHAFASHRRLRIRIGSDRIGSVRIVSFGTGLTCKTSFHFQNFIFVSVFVSPSSSFSHSFLLLFVFCSISTRCF